MRQLRKGWFWPVAGILGILGLGFSLGRNSAPEAAGTPAPVVLKQVRDLGELHLIEHQYQTVFEMESHRDAAAWTQQIPIVNQLASDVVEATTKNTALVTITGSVEAGIDLSQAEIRQDGQDLTIVLPNAKLYPANVDAVLHAQKRAVGWDDRNLSLKARREGAKRFEKSSLEAGILAAAEARARVQVSELFESAGFDDVNVDFVGS